MQENALDSNLLGKAKKAVREGQGSDPRVVILVMRAGALQIIHPLPLFSHRSRGLYSG